MSACAMPTRCSMPFENLRSCSRRSAPMPTRRAARRRACAALGAAIAEQPREVRRAAPRRSGSRRSTDSRAGSRCAAAPRRRRPAGRGSRRGPTSERSAASAASAWWSCRRRSGRGSRRPRPARRRASGDRARGTAAGARSRPRSPWSAPRCGSLAGMRVRGRRVTARVTCGSLQLQLDQPRRSTARRSRPPAVLRPLMKKVGVDFTPSSAPEAGVGLHLVQRAGVLRVEVGDAGRRRAPRPSTCSRRQRRPGWRTASPPASRAVALRSRHDAPPPPPRTRPMWTARAARGVALRLEREVLQHELAPARSPAYFARIGL